MTEICVLKCHGFELNTDLFRLLTRYGTIKKDPKVKKCLEEPTHLSILQRNMVKDFDQSDVGDQEFIM